MQLEFPDVIDNTMRSDFVTCEQKFFNAHIKNLKVPSKSVDLHFGGCFAKGLETARLAYYRDGKPEQEAIAAGGEAAIREWGNFEAPEDHVKNLYSLCDALLSYFVQYPLSRDVIKPLFIKGKPLVECSFHLPIPGIKHPVTKKPIYYAGRFDMIGVFNAANFGVDEKTTKALGPTWSNQWKLRAQFTGYVWGAQSYGIPISGFIIRGIAILKRDITFAEAIESRSKWEINRWLGQLQRDTRRMIDCWKKNTWGYNLDHSCSSFYGCSYLPLCDSQFPERWESNYEVRKWEPLKRVGG